MTFARRMTVADPIHGIIQFDRQDESHRLLLDVMNSRPFQRLRRIKQMGLAEFVFPGATHSRFVHSLGATHLMMKAITHLQAVETSRLTLDSEFEDTGIPISRLLLLGILLHDIGHPPLSHTLEDLLEFHTLGFSHDHYWTQKILLEDEDLRKVWNKYNPKLPEAVIRFMGEGHEMGDSKHFLAQLISSQLDMDRLDYLLRDSHFLGVKYGYIEADRIILNMELAELAPGKTVIAVREEAIPALEHYLFGRHQAYKMALHALDKASEALLKATLDRFRWVREQGMNPGNPAQELFLLMTDVQSLSTAQYMRMDDCYLWEAIHSWAWDSEDPMLREMANRMLKHELLKFVDIGKYGFHEPLENLKPVYAKLVDHYQRRGLSLEFGFKQTLVNPKPMYRLHGREPIYIKTGSNGILDLSAASSLPLADMPTKGHKNLVFVWDKEAKHCLMDALDEYFRHRPHVLEATEPTPVSMQED